MTDQAQVAEQTSAAPTTPAPQDAGNSLITNAPSALDFSAGKPEGFPDEFWDAEKNNPAIDKLYQNWAQEKKRAEGLRVKLSKGEFEGKAPVDIKEYQVELSDDLKAIVPDNDPLLEAARLSAKDAGLPKEAFAKFIAPMVAKIADLRAQSIAAEPTPEEREAERLEEVAKLGPNGHKVIEAVSGFINELQAGGTLNESEAKVAKEMVFNAESAKVFNKLRMMTGGKDQVPIDVPVDVRAARSDIEAKMSAAFMSGNEAEYNKYAAMLAKSN